MKKPNIAFFGTPKPAVEILEWLKKANLMPGLIVSTQDKPKGRNLIITPTPVKVWAEEHDIDVFQPDKLDDAARETLSETQWDLFIVVAYGKIIPQTILNIPKHGALNVHYSLLPKYRGASPIESQILADDKNPGVSIMLLDEKMDHGPLIGTASVEVSSWPPTATELREKSNDVAGALLVKLIPEFLAGKITPVPQNHDMATYTRKFVKTDGKIDLADNPYQNFLKIQAFNEWPQAYFFYDRNPTKARQESKRIRVIIKKAEYKDGKLEILRVIPEGKKVIDYKDFIRSYS